MPDTNNANNKAAEFFLKTIWGKRAKGINFSAATLSRPVTHENIEYLLDYHYPFVQIISTDALFLGETTPNFILAQSGWVIHDYGEALSTSRGNLLYDSGEYVQMLTRRSATDSQTESPNIAIDLITTDKAKALSAAGADGNESDDNVAAITGELNSKQMIGTVVQQTFDTAAEMAAIALGRHWAGLHIVAGNKLMQMAVWAAATNLGLTVSGFEPTKEAELRRQRFKQSSLLAATQLPHSVS